MLSDASVDHPARPSVNYVYVPDVESVATCLEDAASRSDQ